MIISVLQAGLGNQLFQYAAGRALADRLHAPLFLDGSEFFYNDYRRLDLWRFRVRARQLPLAVAQAFDDAPPGNAVKAVIKKVARRCFRTLRDPAEGYDPRLVQLPWFSRIDGYWQSERYFAQSRARLLADFTPRDPLPAALAQWVERVAGEESVAVHVRRGDLAPGAPYAKSVGALHPDFYDAALTRLRERLGAGARAYVFSDDPAWCVAHLPGVIPFEIASGAVTGSAFEDLVAMSRCRHFVIANSTFSWWSAWLGTHPEKQVVAPARFHRVARPWGDDLLPTAWDRVQPIFEPECAETVAA